MGFYLWYNIARNVGTLFRSRATQRRFAICYTYLRLQVRYALLVRLCGQRITEERILDFHVTFPDYRHFLFLFEEIFVRQCYAFEGSTKSPRIIDCGSNIGLSILFFKMRYPRAEIVGFEPNPTAFRILQSNLQRNNLKDVELHNVALHSHKGTLTLYHSAHTHASPLASTTSSKGLQRRSRVLAMPLSSYLHGAYDLLKIDVEGAELHIVRDLAHKHRLRHIKRLVVEYHHHLIPHIDQLAEFLRMLEQHGFGYHLQSLNRFPVFQAVFQDMLISAYRK